MIVRAPESEFDIINNVDFRVVNTKFNEWVWFRTPRKASREIRTSIKSIYLYYENFRGLRTKTKTYFTNLLAQIITYLQLRSRG